MIEIVDIHRYTEKLYEQAESYGFDFNAILVFNQIDLTYKAKNSIGKKSYNNEIDTLTLKTLLGVKDKYDRLKEQKLSRMEQAVLKLYEPSNSIFNSYNLRK